MKRIISWLGILFISLMIVPSLPIFAKEDSVYVIPIENEVEKGLYQFLKRGIEEAEEAGAKAIIFDIDTPGGAVNAATDISELLSSTELTKIAYVNPDAISAGAYIALHADEIYSTLTERWALLQSLIKLGIQLIKKP
ncbi:SDH family Clp fold serine proteinase [Bacillus coahuilensis]|uniref:SDH family Clp fold serine proteinase n=1 Tax=Bacillus coahuilensis TaxID=408580 RepID=UPI0002D8982E